MSPSDPPGKPPADENVVRKRMTDPRMRVPGVPSGEGAPVDDDIPAPRRQTSKSGLNVVRVQEAVEVTGSNLRPAFPPQRVQTQPPPRVPSSPPSPAPPPPLAMDLDDLLGPAPSSPSPARPPSVAPAMPMGAPPPPAFGAMATGSMPRPMAAPPPPASLSTGSLPRPPMGFDPPVEPSGSRPRPTGAMGLDPPVTPEGSGPRPAATVTGTLRRPTGMMGLDPPVESSAPTRRPTGMMSLDPEVEGSASTKRPAVTGSFSRPPPARVATAAALEALGIADEPLPPPPRWPPPWLENVKAVLAPVAGLVTVLGIVIVIAISAVGDGGGPATFTGDQQQRLVALWLKHGTWGQARSDEVVGAVAEVGSSIVVPLISRLGSRTPRFVVLREPNLARVAALPDGTVVVTTGALRRLDSEAQLAAVLAHALAHLAINDVNKALEADLGGKAALAALSTSNPQNAAGLISSLVETPLGHEVQTMDIALEAMKAAGWSPRAMHDAVARLAAHDGHPATPWHGLHPLDPAAMHTLAQASTAGRTNGAEYRTRVLDRVGQLGAPAAAAAPPAGTPPPAPAPTSTPPKSTPPKSTSPATSTPPPAKSTPPKR